MSIHTTDHDDLLNIRCPLKNDLIKQDLLDAQNYTDDLMNRTTEVRRAICRKFGE